MKAIIIGATGLVGKEILQQILADPRFTEALVFSRRTTGLQSPKLKEHIVDFKKINEWKRSVMGDVAFSALGTTRAQAGSIEAQYEVDFTYQAEFAKACAENGVSTFVLISSMSADSRSRVPYTRMKGQLEDFVKALGFKSLHILRPGPLEGPREHRRVSEEIMVPVTRALSHLPFLKFIHPVQGEQVAMTAIQASFKKESFRIIETTEVLAGLNT